MKAWLKRLIGSEPPRDTSKKSTPVAMPESTAPTAAAASTGFAVRRPLVAANGNVAGFEFCLPASVEERMRCARVTFLSSRTNTMLSIPLLLMMASTHHGGLVAG